MAFDALEVITVIKILKEIPTIGSSPLLVIDQNGNEYYAKTTTLNLPRVELINEIFCACALKCWDLLTPSICLIKIPYQLVLQFNAENPTPISARYKQEHFDNTLFFGSHNMTTQVELQDYLPSISKGEFKQLYRPQDLIKIGVFDLWVGNKDRKPDNPNFLMCPIDGKICFYAIDHTAAFAHIADYKEVRDIMLRMSKKHSILDSPFAKNVLEHLPKEVINNLKDEILKGISKFNSEFDVIVDLIPQEWGLSKKAKAHLKNFFTDTERNNRISKSFSNF